MRLALTSVLNCKMDNFVCLLGLVCSTFVSINRATNRRFPFEEIRAAELFRMGTAWHHGALAQLGKTKDKIYFGL